MQEQLPRASRSGLPSWSLGTSTNDSMDTEGKATQEQRSMCREKQGKKLRVFLVLCLKFNDYA